MEGNLFIFGVVSTQVAKKINILTSQYKQISNEQGVYSNLNTITGAPKVWPLFKNNFIQRYSYTSNIENGNSK
jgi:hypothetical protein